MIFCNHHYIFIQICILCESRVELGVLNIHKLLKFRKISKIKFVYIIDNV